MFRNLLVVFCILSAPLTILAQEANTLSEAAISQLSQQLRDGDLKKDIAYAGIKGTYQFDITLHEKGKVLTVFAYSVEGTDIPSQNALKSLIKNLKFKLKIPDGVRVKFNYTFNL